MTDDARDGWRRRASALVPGRARRVSVVVFGLLVVTGLSGCSPANQGAVTLDEASGRPALVVALCENERISAVTLSGSDEYGDPTDQRWKIEADEPRPLTRFVVGEVPAGFTVVDPLDEGELRGEMVLEARIDESMALDHGGSFEFDELRSGVLTDGGSTSTQHELDQAAEANCSNNWLAGVDLPRGPLLALAGALLAFVAGGFVLLMFQLRRPRPVV
jgi:hypothetical protein